MFRRLFAIMTMLVLIFANLLTQAMAQTPEQVHDSTKSNTVFLPIIAAPHVGTAQVTWATFDDTKYNLSIQYPSDWSIVPWQSDYSQVIFTGPENQGFRPEIRLGYDLFAVPAKMSISDYVARFPDESMQYASSKTDEIVAGVEAVSVSGQSDETQFRYTKIRRGEMVWFLWANFNDSADASLADIYKSMKQSLTFDLVHASSKTKAKDVHGTPTSFQAIYGEKFVPLSLDGTSTVSNTVPIPEVSASAYADQWHSPVYGTWTVLCGSSKHTSGATYAADISVPKYNAVVSSKGGSVAFTGWDASGYGNVVKLQTGSYYHVYAHLDRILISNLINGWYVPKDAQVGTVGDTGGVPVHLHFHIHTGNYYTSSATGVNLKGLIVGFAANSNYPRDRKSVV